MVNKYAEFSKVDEWKLTKRCLSKRKYDSKEEAYQKGQDSYQCPDCGKWHRASIVKVKPQHKKRKL